MTVTLFEDVVVVFLPLTVLVTVCFNTSLQVAVLEGATNFEPEILQPPDTLHFTLAPLVGLMREVRDDRAAFFRDFVLIVDVVDDEADGASEDDTLYVGFENVMAGTLMRIPATGVVTASAVNAVPDARF